MRAKDLNLFVVTLTIAACGGSGGGGGGTISGDTTAPSKPDVVVVTADSATSVNISWQSASDNVAVTGYRIYRDSALLKTVASTATSDAGLVTGVSYCYEVSATDAANNESPRSSSQCAMPDNVWTKRLPGADITVEAIIHDGSRYVAVGDPTSTNYVLTSIDGLTWTAHQTNGQLLDLKDIVWTGSQYIATSDNGWFYTSPDAITWTLQQVQTSLIDINALAWSGSVAVAVGEDGNIWSTTDGITWTQHVGVSTDSLGDVEWLNNQFVAVGANGTVLFSTDGTNWTTETTGTADFLATVAWSGNTYVALGISTGFTSSDGMTWAPVPVTGLFEEVVWASGLNLFVVVDSNGRIMTSPDGISWTERLDFNQLFSLDTVFWNGSQLIAGGDIGEIVTSTDAITWETRASAIDFERVRWDGTSLYAVGGPSKLATSPDGVNWSFHRTGYSGDYMRDIARSGTRVLAGAQSYYMSTMPTLESPWPTHDWLGATGADNGVIWDGAQFISLAGNGGLRISTDGIIFSVIANTITGTSELLREIIYTGTQYVIVGYNGTIITSPDLANWTMRASGTTNNLLGVAYSGNTYVAVGSTGTILVSSDAVTWNTATSNTTNTLYGVTWAGDEFVTVGAGTTILTSPDGMTWTPSTAGLPFNTYKGIAFTGSRLVAVGNNGAIVTIEKP